MIKGKIYGNYFGINCGTFWKIRIFEKKKTPIFYYIITLNRWVILKYRLYLAWSF